MSGYYEEDQVLLKVEDLSVVYKTDFETVNAVNGISFELKKGETLGLVGETGAGKTTTALSVMGLLPKPVGQVAEGRISFLGRELTALAEGELRTLRGELMSMIFQDPMTALDPIMPVGKQILEALALHNRENSSPKELEKRVEEVLEMVGIPAERKNAYPHQFSGGMKQRVVIAIAMACRPQLLIADEPTTALDVTIQAQVLALMKELKEQSGMSMLMITHDLGIVAETCDRVAVMYAGEIIELGTLEDIFTGEKHHPYTVGLFGSIPNFEKRVHRLTPIDGLMPDPTALPAGCPFAPRCSRCEKRCEEAKPGVYRRGTHSIRCMLFAAEEEK